MTHLNPSEAASQVDQAVQRIVWTGAAANGALLLGYIGFAGNGADVMASLRYLTLPFALGLAGFSFGVTAITWGLARLNTRHLEALAVLRLDRAKSKLAAFKEVLTSPGMNAEVARLIYGGGADEQARKLIFDGLQVAKQHTEEAEPEADAALADLKMHSDEGLKLLERVRRSLTVSFLAAGLSVAAFAGSAWLETDTPAKAAVAPVEVPAPDALATSAASTVWGSKAPRTGQEVPRPPLAPCRSGATDCQPWERAWKEQPPVGTIVPGAVPSGPPK